MVIFLNVLTPLDATQTAVSNYLIPFFGMVVAAIVLHERLMRFMVVGGLLVLASTLLVTVYEEHRREREAAQWHPPASEARHSTLGRETRAETSIHDHHRSRHEGSVVTGKKDRHAAHLLRFTYPP